jgi:type IV pilus assembly protein PilB
LINVKKGAIGEYLLEKKLISEGDLQRCIDLLEGDPKYVGYKLGEVCLEEGYITLEILGEFLKQPVLDIIQLHKYIDTTTFDALDKDILLSKNFIPYRKDAQGLLSVCMVNIQSRNERNEIIQYLTSKHIIDNGRQVSFFLSTFSMITHVIDITSRRHEIAESALSDAEKEQKYAESLPDEERPRYYFDKILTKAIKNRASDIHIEPLDDILVIRYRVHGALTTKPVYVLPKRQYLQPILAIIKTKAELNVAEKRMPQGGSINYENEEENAIADLRVSFLNTVRGEKCVIRILPKSDNIMRIDDLNLNTEQKDKLLYLAEKPKGMVLVTGPTGSGKTTTLYAVLQSINKGDRNIMTAEDPVEMYIEGLHQVQVNKNIEFTFNVILREFLRQDPDVLLIGEIRDYETAHIATQASETGHLVFSTLHTNSGVETINRLVNMGVPVYLLNAALSAVVAQRLVRTLCPHCKKKAKINEKHKMYIDEKMAQSPTKVDNSYLDDVYYTANPEGCSMCIEGHSGRLAVYEILIFSDKLKHIISSSANVDVIELTKAAIEEGHELMYVDGLRKARSGRVSLDELIRVVE